MEKKTRNITAGAAMFLLLLALLWGALGCARVAGSIEQETGPPLYVALTLGPAGVEEERPPLAGAVQTGLYIVEDLEVRDDALIRGDANVLGALTAGSVGIDGGDITVRNAVVTNTLGVSGAATFVGDIDITGDGDVIGDLDLEGNINAFAGVFTSTVTAGDDIVLENAERIGNDDNNVILLTTENLRVGTSNTFPTNQIPNTIAGGGSNSIFSKWGFIGGGSSNVITGTTANDDARWSFIGGGSSNVISMTEDLGTIVGGVTNQLYGGAAYGFIGGGYENTITGTVNSGGIWAGSTNIITESFGFIGGGYDNKTGGAYATIPGGMSNEAVGDYTFAAGRRAKAMSAGSIVFADSTAADYTDNGANTFNVRATGGGFFSHDLTVGDEVILETGGGVFMADGTAEGVVFFVFQEVAYGVTSTVTSAVIPANADVIDWALVVSVLFNGGGTDVIVCGFDDDADQFVDDMDASAAGRHQGGDAADMQLDEWATSWGDIGAADRTMQCQYTDQNMDASTGAATFMLWYRID